MVLYVMCINLQDKEIQEYCFKKCGKVIVEGVIMLGLSWFSCREETCPFLDQQSEEFDVEGQKEKIVLRKLIDKTYKKD